MSEQNSTDYKLCLKCQTSGDLISKPEKASYVRFIDSINRWAKCKHEEYLKIQNRLGPITPDKLEEKLATWHSKCYKQTINKTNIEKAEKRYQVSVSQGTASAIRSPRVGRPAGKASHQASETSTSKHCTRSSTGLLSKPKLFCEKEKKAYCLFCDKDDTEAALHEVETFMVGNKNKRSC